jgi:transposase
MKFYTKEHQYYCGVDLHTKSMYVCIIDQKSEIILHKNIQTNPESLLKLISPFLPDMAIAVECIFTWYWVADFCCDHDIPFVLGHALYMKAIHGSKTKNDKIDSHKIAALLKAGLIPVAYVYPAEMRATRDLLRRRMFFKHKRSELLGHIENSRHQYLLPVFKKKIAYKSNRDGIAERFPNPSTQMSIQTDLDLLTIYDQKITELELFITQHAIQHNPNNLYLLKSIPGIGKVLALVILYEIHIISRFPTVQDFASYARLIKPNKKSAGKTYPGSNGKIGNAYLKWAFSEAAILMIRQSGDIKAYHLKLKNKHGKAKALAILSHRIGRAVYYILKNKEAFDMNRFLV